MSEVETITVTVVDESLDSALGAYDTGRLDHLIASLQKIRESIPEEYRAIANCEIEVGEDLQDGPCHWVQIRVSTMSGLPRRMRSQSASTIGVVFAEPESNILRVS